MDVGSPIEKYHLRYQFESRTIRFLKGIAHSSNYMVKHVLIVPCGMQILQLDIILHLLETLMDLIYRTHLVDCLNLSRPKRLNPYQCTLIKELTNLLLTRNGVYEMHNFTKSDVENVIKVLATE